MVVSDAGGPENYKFDIFISYSWADREFVEWLCQCFGRAGLRYFKDTSNLAIYDRLDATLKKNIAVSRYLVAVVSASYLGSYWCMFEAMEALQGQDREQRFLPIVLKYKPDDRSLDEDFVLAALADLAKAAEDFEERMIRLKAYELGGKLDKLAFVRSNLPKIFASMQARLYPEFRIWDPSSTSGSVQGLLAWIRPGLPRDIDIPSLTLLRAVETTLSAPQLDPLPKILWKSYVGHCAWKNSPIIVGNDVYIGTAGDRWNEADSQDGLRCLDAESGALKWFAPTPADANTVLSTKGLILTGCDDGSVMAVSAQTGDCLWRQQFETGIVGGPIKLPQASMGRLHEADEWKSRDIVACITFGGEIHVLDLLDGSILQSVNLGRSILAEPTLFLPDRPSLYVKPALCDGMLLISCVDGAFFRVPFYDGRIAEVARTQLSYSFSEGSGLADLPPEPALLPARPVVVGKNALVSFARSTDDIAPPLFMIDLETLEVLWMASDPGGIGGGFGNLRAPPLVVGEWAIIASAYSNKVAAISLETGEVAWAVEIGSVMFEQWPGLVAGGDDVYIARHDGYLHRLNVSVRRREWSIFLGDQMRAGTCVAGDQHPPEFSDPGSWLSGSSWPMLATPVLDRRRLYVGTSQGWLYCLGNLGP